MPDNNNLEFDIYSKFIFPNNIRLFRLRAGYRRLSAFSQECKNITYIRLSKIERGEAAARAEELVHVAKILQIDPSDLLIDVADEQFSIEKWVNEAISPEFCEYEEEKYSVLLASALKLKRIKQLGMTLSQFHNEFGINSIAVSRLENGFKPISKWQPSIQKIIFGIFESPFGNSRVSVSAEEIAAHGNEDHGV